MTYRFQDRLQHTNKRFAEINTECVTYIRGGREVLLDASPILMSSDEISPGGVASLIRIERQDFAIDKCKLGPLYPPEPNDVIKWNGARYKVSSMGSDEPPYVHVTSNRSRLIVHTIRTHA